MNYVSPKLPSSPNKLVRKAQTLIEKLSINPYFPSTIPSIHILAAQKDILENYMDKDVHVKSLHLRKLKKAFNNLRSTIRDIGFYVDEQAKGSAEIILSTGFELRSDSSQTQELESPKNVEIRKSILDGSISLEWSKMDGTHLYIVQMSRTDPKKSEAIWITTQVTSKNTTKIGHLVHARSYYFRVKRVTKLMESSYSRVTRFCAA